MEWMKFYKVLMKKILFVFLVQVEIEIVQNDHLWGEVAASYSKYIIVTSDNPRFEEPQNDN